MRSFTISSHVDEETAAAREPRKVVRVAQHRTIELELNQHLAAGNNKGHKVVS